MRSPDKRAVGLPASLAASPSISSIKIAHINYANVAIIWSNSLFLLQGYPDVCSLLDGLVALGCFVV